MFSIGDVSDIVRTAGYLLLLALAAQGLLELIIVSYSVRGAVVAKAALSAVQQAANEFGVAPGELDYLVRRLLRAMGLGGLRVGALRVDHLTPEQLKEVVGAVDPSSITSLRTLGDSPARVTLQDIASRAQAIYAIAQGSFGERYKRRLQGLMVVASAVVVLAVGADVFSLTAKPAPSQTTVVRDSLIKDNELLGLRLANAKAVITAFDSLLARGVASRVAGARIDSLRSRKRALEDSVAILDALLHVSSEHLSGLMPMLVEPLRWHVWSPRWWVGIFASILLVSLGPKAYQAFAKKE